MNMWRAVSGAVLALTMTHTAEAEEQLDPSRFENAIGIVCSASRTELRVYQNTSSDNYTRRPAAEFEFPTPVFQARRGRLKIVHASQTSWIDFRDANWERFSSAEIDTMQGLVTRGLSASEVAIEACRNSQDEAH